MKRILITGGSGFVGHHVVEHILKNTDWDIVVLDRLDISGCLDRLADIAIWEKQKQRVKFVWHDLKAAVNPHVATEVGAVDYILHLAASTHVDRAIEDPILFVQDNVLGTANLLEFARSQKKLELLINFSTDEVFGAAPVGYAHREEDSFKPSNPYSATKAGAVELGYSYWITYKLPVLTTFTMNNFGERQHPEKLVPKAIRSIVRGRPMPIFAELSGGVLKAVGSRYWLHCRNTASALLFLIKNGTAGERYNIIGFDELTNMEMCEKIAAIIGKKLIPEFVDFHATRPGHDRRYAIDGTKLQKMGWTPPLSFEQCLEKTVRWTLEHPRWL